MKTESMLETLEGVAFLRGASREHLEQIAAAAENLSYDVPDIVFRKGEIADSVYLVVSGKLSLELSPATMECKHLVKVGPGEVLGWSSLVEQQRFAATAVVVEPTQLVRIDGAKIRAICDAEPEFGCEFMRRIVLALAKRLNVTWTQLSHMHASQYLPVSTPFDDEDD